MKFFKGKPTASPAADAAAAGRLRDVVGRGQAEVFPQPPVIDFDSLHSVRRVFWGPHDLAPEGES